MQGFYPNDRMAYGLYEAIAEEGIALFHTGQTGVGSGMPGGNGDAPNIQIRCIWMMLRLISEMKIILAHLIPLAGRGAGRGAA